MGIKRFAGISDRQDDFMEGIARNIPRIIQRRREFDRQAAERRLNSSGLNQTPSLEGTVPTTLSGGETAPTNGHEPSQAEAPKTVTVEGPVGQGRS